MTTTGSPASPPRRGLLKQTAFEEVKRRILDGTFAPGTFVSERELSELLAMSKTPIRSALERLSQLGFVNISPQRGIVIRELSLREVTDHYDLRIALESFVARCLAGRLSAEQVRRITANLDRQRECVAGADIPGYMSADGEFHLMLCEILDNREIVQVMAHQREKLARVVEQNVRRDIGRMSVSADEHATILQALLDDDPRLAEERMIDHLETGKRFLVSSGPYSLPQSGHGSAGATSRTS